MKPCRTKQDELVELARAAIELAEKVLGLHGSLPDKGASYWKARALAAEDSAYRARETLRTVPVPDWKCDDCGATNPGGAGWCACRRSGAV